MHAGIPLSYAASSCAVVQHAGTKKTLMAAIKEEVKLELAAGNTHPLICIDRNEEQQLTALYIAMPEQVSDASGGPAAPLGVCIRRHFSKYPDFLWIEDISDKKDASLWAAVVVKDGLAVEELFNGTQDDLLQLLSRVASSPEYLLTAQRAQLESWLPRHLPSPQRPQWVELPVSPLAKAIALARLEPAQSILRTYRNRQLKVRGSLLTAVLLLCGLTAWSLLGRERSSLLTALPKMVAPAKPLPVSGIISIIGGENPIVRLRVTDARGQSKPIRLSIAESIGSGAEQWQVTDIDLRQGVTFKHLRTGEEVVLSTNKRSQGRPQSRPQGRQP